MSERRSLLTSLGARVHLFVRPSAAQAFVGLFEDVLGCDVVERDLGLPYPIVLVTFAEGGSFSVEFTELAADDRSDAAIDDQHAFRGTWIEFRTRDLDAVHAALRSAGVPEFRHQGSSHAYFSAPGGQVFRVLDVDYRGP
jgi:hypothetical protein